MRLSRLTGGKPIKVFDLPAHTEQDIRWSPDGRAINYVNLRNGVANIWSYPLDGSPSKQLTDFQDRANLQFQMVAGWKNLVLARGTTTSDVVMIRGFR
jgi:hypothetical protein